jgi:glutamine synthetase
VFRHKKVDREKALKLAGDGYPFCDVLYLWDTEEEVYGGGMFRDQDAALDPTSIRSWPFAENEAIILADFTGNFGQLSGRNQLINQLERAEKLGFDVNAAFEFEFNLFDETPQTAREKGFRNLTPYAQANRTYSLRTSVEYADLLEEFTQMLAKMGVDVDALHTELGPGCFEAPLKHARGLKAADDAALFKNFAKAFFAKKGLMACFMSKVSEDLPGQSGHMHISLTRESDQSPAFYDANSASGLSDTAHAFAGGMLTHMPEWLALCAHTTNAYRRLVPGAWAPTYAAWGVQNRTSALRAIPGSPKATRLEFRVPSADTNPYLAMAMALASGLNGIEAGLGAPALREDDCYLTPAPEGTAFPLDLTEAADRLAASASARMAFGDAFVDNFTQACRIEDQALRVHVPAWERARYMEVL